MSDTARKEKVCQEQDCQEQWQDMPLEAREQCGCFLYCPFCANEMITRCSACGEALHDTGFNYCPYCGAQFGA
ncbi:hypothetical protein [Desulfoferula mesophila]|uniref:DZANK-type domain-containing protein n=1 Tax=Desulfoferula mesophila TaxID=3058419 RepID=A0AAU9EK74_9BACT|nr:hypothetical protein FAK_26500 [Desulfoferula mesophilus]